MQASGLFYPGCSVCVCAPAEWVRPSRGLMVQVFIQQAYLFKGLCARLPAGAGSVMLGGQDMCKTPAQCAVPELCSGL